MKSIYLASPYGFSAQQRQTLLPAFVHKLRELELSVFEPFGENEALVREKAPGWAYRVGQRDVSGVRSMDGLFAIVNGCPPDEGVMVELGIAIALGKPTFLFRDDFRRSSDCEDYPLNLMVFTSLPEDGWTDYVYESIDSLDDPTRPLARWAAG